MQFFTMTFTPTYLVSLVYLILCCGPVQPEVSIRVTPERAQFFKQELISLTCEEEGTSAVGWSVRRQSIDGVNGTCGGKDFGNNYGASCIVTPYRLDSGVYWCQFESGEVSPSIKITISDGDVILQSPVHPVPEGGNITFRCLSKDKTSSARPADFYRNGSLFRTESTGQMTILHVSKSDEGFYKCSISGLGESPESWMEATTPAPVSPPKLSPECLSQGHMRVSCSCEGDGVQYSWTLDGQTLRDQQLLSGHHDTNTITLPLGTSGLLICMVYNSFSRGAVGKNISPCPGFRFINCTSSNGTQIPPQWVFDNDTQCVTPVPLGHSEFVYFQVAEMCVLLVVCVGFYIYYKMKTRPPPKQDPLYCNTVVMETQ